jgi:hypothetical protein
LRGPVPDTLADLDAACEARRAALTGAYNAPDVQADRLAIAAEAAAGGCSMNAFPTMLGEVIDRAVAAAATAGAGHTAELLRAARRGEIAFVQPQDRAALVSMSALKRAPRPVLVVVGDDDYQSTGPAGWVCAARLLRWSRWTCIHASGAEVAEYRAIAAATVLHWRALLIETSSAQAENWAAALYAANRQPHGCIVLPGNGLHPVMPDRRVLQ